MPCGRGMKNQSFIVLAVHFFISGTAGHGSLLLNGTAGEKARYLIDKMIDFRQQEEQRLESNPELTLGDVTTINLTMMSVSRRVKYE